MAVINLGNLPVDMENPFLNQFPLVEVDGGQGYIFSLSTVPVNTIVNFGYFVIVPALRVGGLELEIPISKKWYPKGLLYSVVVPVYDLGAVPLQLSMGVFPIQIFRGRVDPPIVTVSCQYEDTLVQPVAYGL